MGGGHSVHPLQVQFVYLPVVLDAFSRRVIGWALGRTLEAELALSALRMVLQQGKPQPAGVHHSDRGVQYASQEYTGLLKEHKPQISMSQGKPIRQCGLRIVPENLGIRKALSQRISRF